MMIHLLNQLPEAQRASLFSDANWKIIRRLAESLPPLSGGGLEVHLNAEMPRNDLMLRATSTDHGRETLAGLHPDWHIPTAWLERESWQRVQSFSRQWADPESALYTVIENVWLEFDVLQDAGASVAADPSIFFDLDRHRRLSEATRRSALQLAFTALNNKQPDNFHTAFNTLLDMAPANSYLYYTGLMLSRPELATVRVCLAGVTVDTIPPLLQQIDCGSHLYKLQAVLNEYALPTDKLVLHLDIGSVIGPEIGIEIFKADNTWSEFFTQMAAAGHCTGDEARKLLDWPGDLPLTDDRFRAKVSKVMQRDVSCFIKRINHVKFVSNALGELKTKAYLYFGHH